MHIPFTCVHTLMISYHSYHTTGIIPFSLFLALQRKIKLEVCTVCWGHRVVVAGSGGTHPGSKLPFPNLHKA